jgi:small membrane protein
MILAQPFLIAALAAVTALYFTRLRSRASDGVLALLCFAVAALFVIRPELSTRLARLLGIGRGVDLVFYVTIPGLALMILLLFARVRELNAKLSATIRELALMRAQAAAPPDTREK